MIYVWELSAEEFVWKGIFFFNDLHPTGSSSLDDR